MTHLFQCNSCGATYGDVQANGMIYFHACAPLPPDKQGFQAERPDKRDENLIYSKLGRLKGIASEGLGVTCLTDAKLSEQSWLAPVRKTVAKGETTDDVDTDV